MSMYNHLVVDLLRNYHRITEENNIDWSVRKIKSTDEIIVPTIPFVGCDYEKQSKKILVYASAENLADYYKDGKKNYWEDNWLDDDLKAENRHRICFENENYQKNPEIPYVHLGPMETGLLLAAVMYIANKLGQDNFDTKTAKDFCESICFGNYGKFSKETELQRNIRTKCQYYGDANNFDYPTKEPALLEDIHEYIKADIEILQPDYIIIPKGIYDNDFDFIESIKGNAKIIKIYQMIASNVHRHIAPNGLRNHNYKKYTKEELPLNILAVYNNMTNVNFDKYLYVFGYLDNVLDDMKLDL